MSFIPWFRRRYACGTGKSFVKEKALRDASAGVFRAGIYANNYLQQQEIFRKKPCKYREFMIY